MTVRFYHRMSRLRKLRVLGTNERFELELGIVSMVKNLEKVKIMTNSTF